MDILYISQSVFRNGLNITSRFCGQPVAKPQRHSIPSLLEAPELLRFQYLVSSVTPTLYFATLTFISCCTRSECSYVINLSL
jgi:hypothetical protein